MKYALVTGGSRGIGRAISVKLASMGYHIIVNYVSNEAQAVETLKLIEEAGSTGELLKFDVSNLDETVAAITGWQAAHKGEYIEVVVNNAGITRDRIFHNMSDDDWFAVMNTFHLCRRGTGTR